MATPKTTDGCVDEPLGGWIVVVRYPTGSRWRKAGKNKLAQGLRGTTIPFDDHLVPVGGFLLLPAVAAQHVVVVVGVAQPDDHPLAESALDAWRLVHG